LKKKVLIVSGIILLAFLVFNLLGSDSPPLGAIRNASVANWGKYPAASGGEIYYRLVYMA